VPERIYNLVRRVASEPKVQTTFAEEYRCRLFSIFSAGEPMVRMAFLLLKFDAKASHARVVQHCPVKELLASARVQN